ncbi:MAG: hypothetical protein ACYC35_20955 [Pirellulales bacterium]
MNASVCSVVTWCASVAWVLMATTLDNGKTRVEQAARHQQEATRTIFQYGGQVAFDDGLPCRIDASLVEHVTKKVAKVSISEEEKMVGAPEGLRIADCLAQLNSLPYLRTLILANRDINDSMLKHLAPLKQIEDLTLGNAPISDAGLEHLKGLKTLQTLTLRKTAVTAAGVKKLRKALPKCTIRVE